jgi:hypothetical protein
LVHQPGPRRHHDISALRTKLTFRLASLHVRAHQDGTIAFKLLPRPAQLNVLADALASEALEELRAAGQPTEFYPLPACRAYLRDGIGHITSCEKRTLRNEFSEYELRAYLQQRNGWTAHILDSINWNAYRTAISAITNQVRTFVIKFSHDWLYPSVLVKTALKPGTATSTLVETRLETRLLTRRNTIEQ